MRHFSNHPPPLPPGVPAAAYIADETGSWKGVFLLVMLIYWTAGAYFALRAKAEPIPLPGAAEML